MSLVTAVIMPVKLFINLATQISSLLRRLINIHVPLSHLRSKEIPVYIIYDIALAVEC